MERQIKFRGLRTEKDGIGWAVGSLILPNAKTNKCYIIGWNGAKFEVIPESVGQFTGLLDKNGVEIYEGDLVTFYTYTYKDGYTDSVSYEEGRLLPFYDDEYIQDEQGDWFDRDKGFEVIGNIHQQ